MRIDIRQESARHTSAGRVPATLVTATTKAEFGSRQKQAFLIRELNSKRRCCRVTGAEQRTRSA